MTTPKAATWRVGQKRLMLVAEKLRTVKPKRFDYNKWVGDSWKGMQDLSCGTTGCALGWASTVPALRRAGLRLGFKRDLGVVHLAGQDPNSSVGYESVSIDAAKHVFGLTHSEARFLFIPHGDFDFVTKCYGLEGLSPRAKPKQLARLIERFIVAKNKAAERGELLDG